MLHADSTAGEMGTLLVRHRYSNPQNLRGFHRYVEEWVLGAGTAANTQSLEDAVIKDTGCGVKDFRCKASTSV